MGEGEFVPLTLLEQPGREGAPPSTRRGMFVRSYPQDFQNSKETEYLGCLICNVDLPSFILQWTHLPLPKMTFQGLSRIYLRKPHSEAFDGELPGKGW